MCNRLPKTVDEAVDQIIKEMSIDDTVKMSKLSEMELAPIKLALRAYVQQRLEESGINQDLKASCCEVAGKGLDEVGASTVIIDELWRKLRGLEVLE